MFTQRQYVDYLIATNGNYTCTNLADHLDGAAAVSHDAVTDFLGRAKLTPRRLWAVVAPLIQDGPDSYLLVDDSVQSKEYSTKIDLVKLQYSGAEHGLVRGIGVINLVHTNGQEHGFYPIDYRIYHKPGDGKTKHDHFLEMLYRAISDKRIQAHTILFDNWYASTRVLKIIHRLDRYFITTLKSNRKVSLSKEAGYVALTDVPWDAEALQHGLLITLKELPFKVRLFKLVAENGDIDWVITNRPDDPQRPMTTDAIRPENAIRWHVEQFHREVKQLTGTERCQCRKARAQRNHLACCYLAWVSLAVHARAAGVTLYAAQKRLWDDYLTSMLKASPIRAMGCA
jgi:hypothetical protein